MRFKKVSLIFIAVFFILSCSMVYGELAPYFDTYTVVRGDSLWKIAVKYQVGLSEIISSNPQFPNPNLIYPGDKVKVPIYSDLNNIEQQVISLTNQERAKYGLSPLTFNWQLGRVARYKSNDMRDNNYFDHTSPVYGSPFTMIKNFNISYTSAGENIAMGQQSAWTVVQGWMNSPGHRANILSTNFTQIGVGYSKSSSGKTYWTQMFIRP